MSSGFLSNSFQLIDLAVAAAARSQEECGPTESSRSNDPLIAILFSAVSCEAFITELAGLASSHARYKPPLPIEASEVVMFSDLYDELEQSRSSLAAKYVLAYGLFSGRAVDKGSQPYQDFALLTGLRNALVHSKLSRIHTDDELTTTMEYPPVVEKLRSKRILTPLPAPNTLTPWLAVVSTPAVATWSVASAATMIVNLIGVIPDGPLRSDMDLFYLNKFAQLAVT